MWRDRERRATAEGRGNRSRDKLDREAEAARLRRVPGGAVRGVHGRGAGDSFAVVGAPGGLSVVLINFL